MLPLFLAVEKGEWALGLVPLALAALRIGIGRRGTLVKQVDRSRYLFAVVLQGGALLASCFRRPSFLCARTSPTDRILEPHSFFSLTAAGNALFTPLLAGVLTIVSLLLGVYALVRFSTFRRLSESSVRLHASGACSLAGAAAPVRHAGPDGRVRCRPRFPALLRLPAGGGKQKNTLKA